MKKPKVSLIHCLGLLEAGSTNNRMIYTCLDRRQGSRDKTWTRKTPIADLMTAIQERGITSNSRFLKSAIGVEPVF